MTTAANERWRPVTQDALEDAELDARAAAERMPTTIDAFRGHPLYARGTEGVCQLDRKREACAHLCRT